MFCPATKHVGECSVAAMPRSGVFVGVAGVGPKFKYGNKIPQNHEHDMELDIIAGNNKWATANELKHKQLIEYDVFKDLGTYQSHKIPPGYKHISRLKQYTMLNTFSDTKSESLHREI